MGCDILKKWPVLAKLVIKLLRQQAKIVAAALIVVLPVSGANCIWLAPAANLQAAARDLLAPATNVLQRICQGLTGSCQRFTGRCQRFSHKWHSLSRLLFIYLNLRQVKKKKASKFLAAASKFAAGATAAASEASCSVAPLSLAQMFFSTLFSNYKSTTYSKMHVHQ